MGQENRLIVSMSLDYDQKHAEQFQNLGQPQLWGEDDDDDDRLTNSSWNVFQSQGFKPALCGRDVNSILSFTLLYVFILSMFLFYCNMDRKIHSLDSVLSLDEVTVESKK